MDKLTDAEIEAIAERVTEKLEDKLYTNVGQGVMGLVWRGVIIIMIGLAGYGVGHGLFK